MSGESLRGAAAIVGVGTSRCGEVPGRSHLELLGEAVSVALADAGLKLSDVDGVFTANAWNFFANLTVAEYLGVKPRYSSGANVGGSSFLAHALEAAMALHHGLCDVALICYGSHARTGKLPMATRLEYVPYESPYNPRVPITAYALAAARYMHQYGATRADLARVAVAARQWANLNPDAFARGPLTVDDVLASRLVADPLAVLDCCLVTDGGGAVIMVRRERARDFPAPPVYLLGAAHAHWHRSVSSMPDVTVTAAAESGPRALAMAGVALADLDVVELYDAFTINVLLFLEDLGFCKKGEAAAFIADGRIAPGGALPVNTNGGGLSCVHPGMYGVFLLIESARQLRGTAGERQVADAKLALCHGNGGVLSSQVTTIWGREPG